MIIKSMLQSISVVIDKLIRIISQYPIYALIYNLIRIFKKKFFIIFN